MASPPPVTYLIWSSVLVCVIATVLSAYVIYRRDSRSQEHLFFALFLVGLGGYVLFYLFLQDPALKDFSYAPQMVAASLAIFGLFSFYYSLAHGGQIPQKILLGAGISLTLPPLLNLIFHPYGFIEEWYGFELNIEFWYLTLITTIYLIFSFYAILGLFWIYLKSENTILRRKILFIFSGLIIMCIFGIIFFAIVPIFFNIHFLKPVGYFMMAIGVIIMIYAFPARPANKEIYP
ncbi:MAG TPA: hypothetical protein VMV49_11460 [Candidatus Deferrimicrobium sp.]|nr:hypothetical protein [Candidatus Deferrimicrobium sp.]